MRLQLTIGWLGALSLTAPTAGATDPSPELLSPPAERPSAPVERDIGETPKPAPEKRGGPVARASLEMAGYTDTDHVNVLSPTIAATIADDVAGWSVSGRYLVDAVSAASVDIVSTASAKWTEYRHVGSGSASYQRGAVGASVSGGVSREPDYLSVGVGTTVSVDLLDKNVTPYLQWSYEHDDVGRTGLATSRWQDMQKLGLQAGVTFVVDRSTIASVAADAIFEQGYLGKPYRYVPVFAPGTYVPPGASVELVNLLRTEARPIEQLPDSRSRYALTGRIAHRWDGVTLRADERLYVDSWLERASTTDVRVFVDLGSRLTLWPHLRFHAQTAVKFWQRAYHAVPLPDGNLTVPRWRTGDRELGELYTLTTGAGLRWKWTDGFGSWFLGFQLDAASTRYLDALFTTGRTSLFSAATVETEW